MPQTAQRASAVLLSVHTSQTGHPLHALYSDNSEHMVGPSLTLVLTAVIGGGGGEGRGKKGKWEGW